jgi:hypothetical protein
VADPSKRRHSDGTQAPGVGVLFLTGEPLEKVSEDPLSQVDYAARITRLVLRQKSKGERERKPTPHVFRAHTSG